MESLYSKLIRRFRFLIEIIRKVKNWPSLLLFFTGFKQNVTLVFRSGIAVKIDKSKINLVYYLIKIHSIARVVLTNNNMCKLVLSCSEELVFSLDDESSIYRVYVLSCLYKKLNIKFYQDFCEFYFQGKKVKYFYDQKDFSSVAVLCMTFVDEQYGDLNVKGRVVADIGAGYGDTTIYFALKGAKKVYAYEPIPWIVELLEKNIKHNNLTETVKICPYAVSSTKGNARISIPKTATDAASLKYNFKGADVIQISVKTVTPPEDVEVVKLDCEGCEYDIILNWLKSKLYDEILMEYHEDYKSLERKLRKLGYKVKIQLDRHLLFAR